jgi:hypothetical protein
MAWRDWLDLAIPFGVYLGPFAVVALIFVENHRRLQHDPLYVALCLTLGANAGVLLAVWFRWWSGANGIGVLP